MTTQDIEFGLDSFVPISGFDAVNAGSLAAGLALQPGGPVFGISHTRDGLSNLLRSNAPSPRADDRALTVQLPDLGRPTAQART
jgi:hypothetical protein